MRRTEVFLEVGLLIVFGLLTLVVMSSPVLSIDVDVERAIQAFHPPWLDTLTTWISWVGFPPQSNIIDGLILLAIFLIGRRWEAVCALFAVGGSVSLWFFIAPLVHRPRPTADLVRVAFEIPYGSFPSGHVLDLTAFLGFLAFLSIRLIAPGAARGLAVAACTVVVVGIGYARMYSGEHWPSDVLAGYVLGVAWLLPTVWLYRWGAGRWSRERSTVDRGAATGTAR
jgi:undecaprenyl-diphosphatase